jgi:hypothetical protein
MGFLFVASTKRTNTIVIDLERLEDGKRLF